MAGAMTNPNSPATTAIPKNPAYRRHRLYEDDAVDPKKPAEVLGKRGQDLGEQLAKKLAWKDIHDLLKTRYEEIAGSKKLKELAMNLVTPDPSGDNLREALLMAIDDGCHELVEDVAAVLVERGVSVSQGCADSAFFGPHMTPLMLASIRNDFQSVALFLRMGIRLKQPHMTNCLCPTCAEEVGRGESAERAITRVDNFRAFASTAYIFLSSHDPILLAFDLSNDLHKSIANETQNKDKYAVILKQVQGFAGRLGALLRSHEEVKLVMQKTEGIQLPSNDFLLPRLRLALDSYMKEFLAQFAVQTELHRVWDGSWADSRVAKPPVKVWRFACHTFLYPITALIHLFSGGRAIESYNNPRARFLTYFASYITFIISIFALVEWRLDFQAKGPSQNTFLLIVQVYVWVYIAGLIMWDFLRILKYGPSRFLSVWWASANLMMNVLFIVAFGSWLQAWWEASRTGIASLPRKHWVWYDPQLVFEAAFALACVFATARILYFLQLIRIFGPTVISVGRCSRDIVIFCLVIFIVIVSFAMGLNFIYEPYMPDKGTFSGMRASTLNLYWSFFGHLSPSDLKLQLGSEKDDAFVGTIGLDGTDSSHILTFQVGRFIVVAYNVFIVVVLLNLMVAMMCNSAGEIIMNEDTEWKFVRCHIWAEFMETSNALPPPFNLFWWWVTWVPYASSKRRQFQLWPPNLWFYEPRNEFNKLQRYKSLMMTLYLRYMGLKKIGFAPSANLEKGEPAGSIAEQATGELEEILKKRV